MAAQKNIPKDAQVMMAILKEMGVTEYEPRVINQMLEFSYRKRYLYCILWVVNWTIKSPIILSLTSRSAH